MPDAARLVVVLGYSNGRDGLHPVCAARLAHAAGLVRGGDTVLLSGWTRRPGRPPEAELMRRAWTGSADSVLCDPDARVTAENAANAAAHARELGAGEVVVVTSRWHRRRARVLFERLLPDVPITVEVAPTAWSARLLLRELAVFPLVPFQVGRARRRAARISGGGRGPGAG